MRVEGLTNKEYAHAVMKRLAASQCCFLQSEMADEQENLSDLITFGFIRAWPVGRIFQVCRAWMVQKRTGIYD